MSNSCRDNSDDERDAADKEQEDTVTLCTSADNCRVTVPNSSLRLSGFFTNVPLVESDGDDDEVHILDERVTGVELRLIGEYMWEYADKDPPLDLGKVFEDETSVIDNLEDYLTPWEQRFVERLDREPRTLMNLSVASFVLDMESLNNLVCCKLGMRLQNKMPDEIGQDLGFDASLLTDEERALLLDTVRWTISEDAVDQLEAWRTNRRIERELEEFCSSSLPSAVPGAAVETAEEPEEHCSGSSH